MHRSHSRHTLKPGMIAVEEMDRCRGKWGKKTRRELETVGFNFGSSSTRLQAIANKFIKKFHNRKSRYFLNKLVEDY
jgi:hypothetical protein